MRTPVSGAAEVSLVVMAAVVDVVQRWHDTVNDRDIEGAVSLCRPDVAIGGPRGVAEGQDLVRQWLLRTGIILEPQGRLEEQDGRVVVHEHARWRATQDAPDAAPTTAAVDTWVVFEVTDGLITALHRYESIGDVPRV